MAKMKASELKKVISKLLKEQHEFEGSFVIDKIESAITHHNREADQHRQSANDIEEAWKEWDFDYLIGSGVITQKDKEYLDGMHNEEISDGYELNPDVYEALKSRKVSLAELRPLSVMGSFRVDESLAKKNEKVIRENFWKKNRGKMIIGISGIGKGKDGNTYVYYDEIKGE